ncbi:MAG: sigma-70 family RNA polymerase sigma factor [Actinobacteria bacterium]|nr:sigma-70 family RNA polymerase sigma factor [Actinomycetota bacterium]
MPTEIPAGDPASPSADDSRLWLERLGASGPRRDAAIVELHALLLKAARFEIDRRRASLPHLRGDDWEDLAHESAADALSALLAKLGDFRGEARFTTWAYKFALLEASVKTRRRGWQGREIPIADDAWARLADTSVTAGAHVEDTELMEALRQEMTGTLTKRQREVLVAVTLNDVPIDVLAERLETTRGALYKTLHDARRKLRIALAERGFRIDGTREEAS